MITIGKALILMGVYGIISYVWGYTCGVYAGRRKEQYLNQHREKRRKLNEKTN